jgi:3-hydroxybutyryl-CoA dehydrogenase
MSDAGGPAPSIACVGVVGAGQMGNGIAHVSALAGLSVVMSDISEAALQKGLATIGRNMDRQVSREQITADAKAAALARIASTTDYAAFSACDIVIEAATEREQIKHTIFKALLGHIKPSCILASNTSSIGITRLAAPTDRPAKFIGMHFFNPVPLMKLVEIIRGMATDDATFDATKTLAERLGKTVAVSADSPGFLVNRTLMPMINEAIFAVFEGVGSVTSVDTAMKLGANHPMGPLELADFIGLDTCLEVMRVLYDGFGDSKFRACPLLVKYVEAGWLGRKSGRGFYDYSQKPPVPTH